MEFSENHFSKCFGIRKVLLKHNEIPRTVGQEIKKEEVLDEKWFNRFTYESCKNIYDVDVEVNTTNVKYYYNMVECKKHRYHVLIEKYYAEDIKKSMGVR